MALSQTEIRGHDYEERAEFVDCNRELTVVGRFVLESIVIRSRNQAQLFKTLMELTTAVKVQSITGIPTQFQEFADPATVKNLIEWAVGKAKSGERVANSLVDFAFILLFKSALGSTEYGARDKRAIEQLSLKGLGLPLLQQRFGGQVVIVRSVAGCRLQPTPQRKSLAEKKLSTVCSLERLPEYKPPKNFVLQGPEDSISALNGSIIDKIKQNAPPSKSFQYSAGQRREQLLAREQQFWRNINSQAVQGRQRQVKPLECRTRQPQEWQRQRRYMGLMR